MSSGLLSVFGSLRHKHSDIPHRVTDSLKSATDLARHEANKAVGFIRHEARAPLQQLKRDPVPAIVALLGALCAVRLLTRGRR